MLTRSIRLAVVASAIVVLSGCRLGSLSINYHDDDHHRYRPVRVTGVYAHAGHVCSQGCHDHYWDGTGIVVLSGHRHGSGCGHYWDGGHWIVTKVKVKSRRFKVSKARHVHGPSCGHAYRDHNRKWIKIRKGHVHGSGCGHVFIEGRWTIHH